MKTEEMKTVIDHYLADGRVPPAVLEYVLLQISARLDPASKPETGYGCAHFTTSAQGRIGQYLSDQDHISPAYPKRTPP